MHTSILTYMHKYVRTYINKNVPIYAYMHHRKIFLTLTRMYILNKIEKRYYSPPGTISPDKRQNTIYKVTKAKRSSNIYTFVASVISKIKRERSTSINALNSSRYLHSV